MQMLNNVDVASLKVMLPLIITTGFLDGINPCAIAVLIFFIAFLFTLQRTLGHIFKLGAVYIVVIYLTYLGIGLGLFEIVHLFGQPHLVGKVASWLLIVLGLVNVKDYFAPHLPFHLRIPKFSEKTLKIWLTKATLPAVVVAAFLVGLCTFPCSGSIYVVVVSLLASKMTYFKGLLYLLLYNLMFVVPLIILLAAAGNRFTLVKLAEWQSRSEKTIKLVMGLLMIVLGTLVLLFFV